MIQKKKVIVVMPAYNAEKTLRATYSEIPKTLVDDVILVDDASGDRTVRLAKKLGICTFVHASNRGYGANQKTCYTEALRRKADIVVMLHPDYQYTPKLMPAMVGLLTSGLYDVVLGSRILGGQARAGGMPSYKYIGNRLTTMVQNVLMGTHLSEFHTGYRAFTRHVLEEIPWRTNSDDFVFDNQMLSQIIDRGFRIAEVTCPANYFKDASTLGFDRSVTYGLGCLSTAFRYRMSRWGWMKDPLFLGRDH